MKKLLFVLLLALTFASTGCINILEEMFLNKDGSGKYSVTIDMSALMEESTRQMLQSFAQAEEGEEGSLSDMEMPETDTVMMMKDLPADQRGELSRPDFYDKVSMRIQSSEAKELLKIGFVLDFDKADDIDYFLKNIDKMFASADMGADNPMSAMGGGGGMFGGMMPATGGQDYQLFDIGKKMLKRAKAPAPAELDDEAAEGMAMMKMFLAGAEYKTVYHFPGNVKSASNSDAKIDGKTVTIKTDLLDVMEGNADLSTEVKFKKR